jgi:hypothetical protein
MGGLVDNLAWIGCTRDFQAGVITKVPQDFQPKGLLSRNQRNLQGLRQRTGAQDLEPRRFQLVQMT